VQQEIPFVALEAEVQAGEDAFRAGRYRDALQLYSQLLARRLRSGNGGTSHLGAADLVIVERVAELATLFGHFAAADDLLQGVVELARGASNDLAADYTLLKRTEISLAKGVISDAMSQLQELRPRIGDIAAIDISPSGLLRWERSIAWNRFAPGERITLLTRAYHAMAQILVSLGQYRQGIMVLDRGLTHSEGNNAPDLARRAHRTMRLLRARALLENGDLEEADAALQRMAASQDDVLAPGYRTQRLELASKLAMMTGQLGSAVQQLESVIKLCRAGDFVRAGATARVNLAHILILLNRVADALRLVDDARHWAMQLGDESLASRCVSIAFLAVARRRSPAAAVSVALSVTAMMRGRRSTSSDHTGSEIPKLPPLPQSDAFLDLFEDRALEFQWALGAGDLSGARARLAALHDAFGNSESRLIRARLLALSGLFAQLADDPATADTLFSKAEIALTEMALLPELWQVLYLHSRCADRLAHNGDARRLVAAAEALQSELTSSLPSRDRAVYLLNKATAQEDFIKAQIDELIVLQARVASASLLSRPFLTIRLMRRLEALLDYLDEYKATMADRQLTGTAHEPMSSVTRRDSLRRLLRRLTETGRDRALLSFVVLPDRVLTVWCTFMKLGFAVAPLTRLELRERVRAWHELVQYSSDSVEDGHTQLGEITEALHLRTVLSALPSRVNALTIVPDDVLHGMPFAALRHDANYLIERFALSIGFSMRALNGGRAKGGSGGLVVAVSRGSEQLPPIPQAKVEAQEIAAWMRDRGVDVTFLLDEEASRQAVLGALSRASVAHLACHGIFEPDRPDASGILLVPAPGSGERLTLRELSAAQLGNCEHITLSSCWSADNFILPSHWIISLPETLWRRGVKSVLGSLWQVDDMVARAFMARFYGALERLPRDAALREAQLACLTNKLNCIADDNPEPIDTRSPLYWSGFNLYGTPDRLHLSRQT
jgi:CHAT domain-containing protein